MAIIPQGDEEVIETQEEQVEENKKKREKKPPKDKLKKLKKDVEQSYKYFRENYRRLNDAKRLIFKSTLSRENLDACVELNHPPIECNLLEAFLARQRGEFAKQEPSIEVTSHYNMPVDPQLIDIVEGHFRYTEHEARKNGTAFEVYTEALCGYSVIKLVLEYENNRSFEQCLRWEKAFDATLCGFDPLARLVHKGDGRYFFELYPKTKDEFEQEYPDIDISKIAFGRTAATDGFNWSYGVDDQKILLICDFYEKSKKKIKIIKIAETPFVKMNGINPTMTMSEYEKFLKQFKKVSPLEQAPEIIQEREVYDTVVSRYRFIENQMLEYIETTEYPGLPGFFVDGNSMVIKDTESQEVKQVTRALVHNAEGTQKLANVALQALGNELQNIMAQKIIAAKESIPPEYLAQYTDTQVPSLMLYNAFLEKQGADGQSVQIPPPFFAPRPPIPPEILQTLQMAFQLVQNVLGTYDSALGINDNQLSGIAVVESATQNNATTMPNVINYMLTMSAVAQMYIQMLPKVVLSPRTLPYRDRHGQKGLLQVGKLDYNEYAMKIKVEAGQNFSIQKARTLRIITELAKGMPVFGEFVNTTDVLQIIIKLLELPGAEGLMPAAQQFIAQKQAAQKAAQNQPNPMIEKLQNEKANIQRMAEKDKMDNQLEIFKTHVETQLEVQRQELEKIELAMDIKRSKDDVALSHEKHKAEVARANADLAIRHHDSVQGAMKRHHDTVIKATELKHNIKQANKPNKETNTI